MTRKLLPHWKEKQSGHVITVTSVFGLAGMAFSTTYSSSKFAMEGYFESLALELLPFKNIKYVIFCYMLLSCLLYSNVLYCSALQCVVVCYIMLHYIMF